MDSNYEFLSDCELELDEYESGEDMSLEDMQEDKYCYEVLSSKEIVTDMLKKITSINTILQLPNTVTRILLHHFKWDEDKLLEKFYTGNRAVLFKEARVVDPASISNSDNKLSVRSIENCTICMNLLSKDSMTGLECEHQFCGDCWNEYLSLKVMNEGECLTIACPAYKCDILVDDTTAMTMIKDPKVKAKYQHLITLSFVEYNRLLKWCPAPDCNRAIKVQYLDSKPVTCHCGQTFCFKCNEKWHAPILCEYLRNWLKKLENDAASSAWVELNTKKCPNCFAMIEKNGGCNHMTCKKCKHEFCWICSEKWKQHNDFYICNRYREDQEAQETNSTMLQLKRYLFHSERYLIHMYSLELENNLYKAIEKKAYEFQLMTMSWAECQFLKNAVTVLCQCRQTLMYTYAFAFYLEKSNQTTIFEDNQQDLEKATETLSHYLEQDIENEELSEIKRKVLDKTFYCEQRRKALVDHVSEGYDKDWWSHLNIV